MLKKILKWLWEFLEILIIIYVIFITSCILCRNKFGYTQFGDMTFVTVSESNEKFFMNNKAGDLLIIKNQQMNLDVNDLIYYYILKLQLKNFLIVSHYFYHQNFLKQLY